MAKGIVGAWLMLAFLIIPATWAQETPPVRDLAFFLSRLRTVNPMPELEASHTAIPSTWDRSGGNGDGTDFKNIVKPTAAMVRERRPFVNGTLSGPARRFGTPLRLNLPVRIDRGFAVGKCHWFARSLLS